MLYIPRYDISMDRFVRQISILQDIRGSRGVGVRIWKIWRPPSPPLGLGKHNYPPPFPRKKCSGSAHACNVCFYFWISLYIFKRINKYRLFS